MNKNNTAMFETVFEYVPKNCQWVELGAWTGKSTAYCAVELMNRKKFGRFVTVDNWSSNSELSNSSKSIKEIFLENISPIKDNIEVVHTNSWEAAEPFQDESLDFCYVDAGHTYDDVMKDLTAWWPKIKQNSYFGGDDYTSEFPGVVSAVHDFFKDIEVTKIGRCWLVKKQVKL